jgi:HEAT repeat protein
LWRFKAVADVEPLLRRLVSDATVTYMAMSSLQRTIGAEAMLPLLEQLLESSTDSVVRAAADRQLRRVRRKLARLHT